jgi:signal transduction histidine kinase
MTEDVRRRIFEPFFTTKARGVGLGLAVCQHVVTSHGGDVRVSSAPGAGTEFTVVLPMLVAQRPAPEVESGVKVEQ